jgi:hypothetical protein
MPEIKNQPLAQIITDTVKAYMDLRTEAQKQFITYL